MKILIVDDSVVFRSQIKQVISELDGIGEIVVAQNGKIGLEKLKSQDFNLVTLDMEMPEMNGLEVLKEMSRLNIKTKSIVFSAVTEKGAELTLQALNAGATDFVTKPKSSGGGGIDEARNQIRLSLLPKVIEFLGPATKPKLEVQGIQPGATGHFKSFNFPKLSLNLFRPHCLVIASSTGGPQALEKGLKGLPKFDFPILIAQHMPPLFTKTLANRLAIVAGIPCDEAKHGEIVRPGHIYVAPGDNHMEVIKNGDYNYINLHQKPLRNSIRPAADYLFESAVTTYGSKVLGVVFTGMGQDGLDGTIALKEKGARVVIQDKQSSVVWGMPGAVFESNTYDEVMSLEQINNLFKSLESLKAA